MGAEALKGIHIFFFAVEIKWIGLERWQLSYGLSASTHEGLRTQPCDYPALTARL